MLKDSSMTASCPPSGRVASQQARGDRNDIIIDFIEDNTMTPLPTQFPDAYIPALSIWAAKSIQSSESSIWTRIGEFIPTAMLLPVTDVPHLLLTVPDVFSIVHSFLSFVLLLAANLVRTKNRLDRHGRFSMKRVQKDASFFSSLAIQHAPFHPMVTFSSAKPHPSPKSVFLQTGQRNRVIPACEAFHWFLRALWASPESSFFSYVKLKEPSFARMQPARVRMQMSSMNPRPRLHPFRHAPRMSATIPRRDSKERSCLHSVSFSGVLPKLEPLRQYGLAITNSSM